MEDWRSIRNPHTVLDANQTDEIEDDCDAHLAQEHVSKFSKGKARVYMTNENEASTTAKTAGGALREVANDNRPHRTTNLQVECVQAENRSRTNVPEQEQEPSFTMENSRGANARNVRPSESLYAENRPQTNVPEQEQEPSFMMENQRRVNARNAEPLKNARMKLLKAWQRQHELACPHDYRALIKCIMDYIDPEMCPRPSSEIMQGLYRDRPEVFIDSALKCLLQIHEDVMSGLILGDLPERYQKDHYVQCNVYRWLPDKTELNRQNDDSLPCIYVQYIADRRTGEAPKREHVLQLCDGLERLTAPTLDPEGAKLLRAMNDYVSDHRKHSSQANFDIFDHCCSGPKDTSAEQKRLSHRDDLQVFVEAVRRLVLTPSSTPIALTFAETGLTESGAKQRLPSHLNFNSTPLVLTLVRAYFGMKIKHTYGLWQFVVAYADSNFDLRVAESLITNLTSSYVKAGGCNTVAVGMNAPADDENYNERVRETLYSSGFIQRTQDISARYNLRLEKTLKGAVEARRLFDERQKRVEAQRVQRARLDAEEQEALARLKKKTEFNLALAREYAEEAEALVWAPKDEKQERMYELLPNYNNAMELFMKTMDEITDPSREEREE